MHATTPTTADSAEHADAALFGHDATTNLVALHPVAPEDSREAQVLMRVYQRQPDSAGLHAEDAPFYPFFFLSDMQLLRGFPRQRYRLKTLAGDNAYRYLVVFHAWQTLWDAVRHLQNASGQRSRRPEQLYLIPNPEQQYLMQTGRTLFKGMTFDDLHRLQLDIEVFASGAFPNAERGADRIIAIALTDNRGWRHVISGLSLDEPDMLRELVRLIRERDPDVIEGHNIYAFDLAYIMARCERYGVPFAVGRDGSTPRPFASNIRFAERTVEYPALDIAGRHVIDTYFQVMSFDVFKRDLPGYGLKAAAQYFGFAADNRTYIEGPDIARVWQCDPERLLAYALDDVIETERLARHLSGSAFYLTQMLPMAYGKAARTGPAAKIEALLAREYLRQRQALPMRQRGGGQMRGGYTAVLRRGVLGPVVYADVESLYPSIMLNYDVKPASDHLGLFQRLLRSLTGLRLDTKRRMEDAATPDERGALDAQQSSYKILINSFYGQLGFSRALFNDFAEADRVAATGQEILKQMMAIIQREGGAVIEVDTDGVFFTPPPAVEGEAAERAFVARINGEMPTGIRIGFDGRFQKMLSYKSKNYALMSYDGRMKFKGSSLVSRSIERFGRQFVETAIPLLVQEDIQGLHDLYVGTYDRIARHDWGVDDFARTETLKDSVERYQRDVAEGRRSKAASYELALKRAQQTGQPVHRGDRIAYYITGGSPTVTAFDNARFAEAWDAAQPDENTLFYLKRLEEFARKFTPFFRPDDFQQIFGPPGLFPFRAEGVTLLTTHDQSDI